MKSLTRWPRLSKLIIPSIFKAIGMHKLIEHWTRESKILTSLWKAIWYDSENVYTDILFGPSIPKYTLVSMDALGGTVNHLRMEMKMNPFRHWRVLCWKYWLGGTTSRSRHSEHPPTLVCLEEGQSTPEVGLSGLGGGSPFQVNQD